MNAIAIRLILAAVAALTAACGFLYVRYLMAELETAHSAASAAQEGVANRDAMISQMLENYRQDEQARQDLETERNGIRSSLASRENLIRKLQDENAEFRTWSDVALPAPVVRLREHGAITGAAAYRDSLSGRDPLHAAGDDSPN